MNKMPGLLWLKADDVAREGYDAVMKGHSVVVNGAIYRLLVWLTGALPRSLSRWVSGASGPTLSQDVREPPRRKRPYHPPWLRRC